MPHNSALLSLRCRCQGSASESAAATTARSARVLIQRARSSGEASPNGSRDAAYDCRKALRNRESFESMNDEELSFRLVSAEEIGSSGGAGWCPACAYKGQAPTTGTGLPAAHRLWTAGLPSMML